MLKRAERVKDTYSRDCRIVVKLFTDIYIYLTCEDDFWEFCNKHKRKKNDSKVAGSGPRQVVDTTVAAAAKAMDTEIITDTGASACNLHQSAAVFTPVQSRVSQVAMPLVPITQLPSSYISPS